MAAFVMNIFRPFSRQPSPSRTARVVIAATSDPVCGSVTAQAPSSRPSAMSGSHRCRCSGKPCRATARATR